MVEYFLSATSCKSPVFEKQATNQPISLPGKADWVGEAYWKCGGCSAQFGWKCGGCSAQFGFLLLQNIFTDEVLRSSNISGKRGLKKLDEQMVKLMKSYVKNLFKIEGEMEMKLVIDKINIKLKNKKVR